MPFPVDPGHRDYDGFLHPTIWSPLFVDEFYDSTPLEMIANTDYEGEITGYGSSVNIRLVPEVNSHEYSKGQDLVVDVPEQEITTLNIDKGEYFNMFIEDVDRAQSDIDYLYQWTTAAGKKQVEKINANVLGQAYLGVPAENKGNTAGADSGLFDLGDTGGNELVLTNENIIDVLGRCAAVLDEQNVPEEQRWMVVPPWFRQLVLNSKVRDQLIAGGNEEMLRKGYLGTLMTFPLYLTNRLAKTNEGGNMVTSIMFGHRIALTFASQLVNSEVISSERKFGKFARGIHVYGWNVNKPSAMGLLYARYGGVV